MIESLESSPEPGVRRQLLVILAGLGEQLILRVHAQDDSDPFVRATACRYLIQTSLSTDSTIHQFLCDRLFHDRSPVVQQAILQSAQPEYLKLPLETLLTLEDNNNDEISQLATEHLLARASQNESFFSILVDSMWQEADDGLRGYLLSTCLDARGGQRMIEMCTGRATSQVFEVLQILTQNDLKFSLGEISSLINPNNSYVNAYLAYLLKPSDAIQGWGWLAKAIADAVNSQKLSADFLLEPSPLWKAESLLIDLTPQLKTVENTTIDCEVINTVITYFCDRLQEVENYLEAGADDPGHDYDLRSSIEEYRDLIDALDDILALNEKI